MTAKRNRAGMVASAWARTRIMRLLDVAIILSAMAVVALGAAAAWPPRFAATIPADAIRVEGGQAFSFNPGFKARWPFLVPTRPAFPLQAGDVRLAEDGRFIGTPTASHDEIRNLGEGRYDFWNGELWFSSSEGGDPRADGRIYGVRVKGRLAGTAAMALAASLAILIALVVGRTRPALQALRSRPMPGWASSHVLAPAARLAGRVPLTFGRTFAAFCATLLGVFAWNSLVRPMPLLFGDDSFTYVYPGVLWRAGASLAGQSTRDLGYAALTAAALWFGSLRTIPLLQLLAVLSGTACMFGVLYLMLSHVATRLWRVSVWTLAPCACAVAAAYGLMLASHDGFVLDIDRALAEAFHFLPTALTLLCLVLGWVGRTPARRLGSTVLSVPAAYLSTMVKPHTLLVLALCTLCLLATAIGSRRQLRSPIILALCTLSVGLIFCVHRFDVYVTPANSDFGSKTLFCNHLDVVEPVFDTSTPERSRVQELIRSTLRHQHPDWPLLGYHGDTCTYGAPFNRAMEAAARSEGLESGAWEGREFIKSVARNPFGYARAIWKQVAFFMADPISDVDGSGRGVVTEQEWRSFKPYAALIRMPQDQFEVALSNWVPAEFPLLASLGKALLGAVSTSFAPVTLGATLAAAITVLGCRAGAGVKPELALLVVAAFEAAFVLTPALAHTFDVHRYETDILPVSLLWWAMSTAYLTHGLVLAGTSIGHSSASRRPHRSSVTSGSSPIS